MGYRIQYGETATKEFLTEASAKGKTAIRAISVLIVCCILLFVLFGKFDKVIDAVVPGDKDVTKAAFSGFVDDLRQGDSVTQAFAAFCREIVDNANIPD